MANKSGLVAYEDKYMHTIVECEKCHKMVFQGCSLGLTISDIKECPNCGAPINPLEKWKSVAKKK